MANIKSAKKRIKVIKRKTLENKFVRTRTKTSIKKFEAAVAKGDVAEVQELLKVALSDIEKCCNKGIFHKNKASRNKSRLMKMANKVV